MAKPMAIKKHALKSKTNWVQVPFIGVVASALAVPEVQTLVCQNGQLVIGAQILVTLIARNLGGNIRFRKQKEE